MNSASLRGMWAVAAFETRRSMTWPRLLLWLVLTGFPIGIVTVVYISVRDQLDGTTEDQQVWQLLIFVLTEVTVALSVLLWASSAVQVELENRTWVYAATRPYGRRSTLIGRYGVAVLWAASANLVSVLTCCLIAGIAGAIVPLLFVTLLSCFAFASLFSLLAVMFPKRAMSVAFGLTLLLEIGIGFIPAMIHQFSIQYHLRCLLAKWLWEGSDIVRQAPILFSELSSLVHIAALGTYIVTLLWIAVVLLESRELPTDDI